MSGVSWAHMFSRFSGMWYARNGRGGGKGGGGGKKQEKGLPSVSMDSFEARRLDIVLNSLNTGDGAAAGNGLSLSLCCLVLCC